MCSCFLYCQNLDCCYFDNYENINSVYNLKGWETTDVPPGWLLLCLWAILTSRPLLLALNSNVNISCLPSWSFILQNIIRLTTWSSCASVVSQPGRRGQAVCSQSDASHVEDDSSLLGDFVRKKKSFYKKYETIPRDVGMNHSYTAEE